VSTTCGEWRRSLLKRRSSPLSIGRIFAQGLSVGLDRDLLQANGLLPLLVPGSVLAISGPFLQHEWPQS
jgi:hypothetical protein